MIFITEKDHYRAGKPIYEIQNINVTLSQPFGDGAHILYVNGEYRGDSDIGRLMHDFNCADAGDMNFKIMAEKTRYLKESKEGVSKMCREMEMLRNESYAEGLEQGIEQGLERGIEQGLEQGLEQGMREQARNMAIKLRLSGESLERIADLVGYSAATVEQWLSPVG